MQRYLMVVLAGAFATCMMVGAVNWTIDPYWIWKSPAISGASEFKPAVRDNIRIFKLGARRLRPEIVILGTSRADDGLDPRHPAFEGRRVFNLAVPAQPYEESLSLFRWATAELGTKSVVLPLDFFVANAYSKMPADFQEDNAGLGREAKLLFSLDTLVESVRTVEEQGLEKTRSAASGKYNNYREDGLRIVGNDKAKEWGGHRNGFLAVEEVMLNDIYLPPPKCAYAFGDTEKSRFPLQALRTLIAEAHRKKIDLRLAISPIHARLAEAIAAAGLWDQWEDWKRQIVEINEAEGINAGQPAFALWDFSGYSQITTERVPAAGDADTRMQWYWESSHYKKETGDIMLDRMFDKPSAPGVAYADFGMRLTRATLDAHLRKISDSRAQFRKQFPGDIAEIEHAAKRAALHRQALGCSTH